MDFDPLIEAQLSGATVSGDVLVELDFLSGPVRVWNGFGRLRTLDDREWMGIGGLGSVSDTVQMFNGGAPELTMTVSGVDESFASKVRDEAEEYRDRVVRVYIQFFSLSDSGPLPIVMPYARSWARMKSIKSSRQETDTGYLYSLTISAETPFESRRRPKFSYWTDRDQQQRYPGDRGCERVAGIQQKLVVFPDF